jgi:hypothetical protein
VSDARLFVRLRDSISLTGVRTGVLLIAASLSISGYVYGYLKAASSPTHGELLTVVRDRGQTPLSDAHVEVLTPENAPVASFSAAAPPGGSRVLKEGTYRLRVSHPKYVTETRMVQVIAGHTSEVRVKLGPRVVPPPPPAPTATAGAAVPVNDAKGFVGEGVDSIKKIFKK